MKTTKLIFEAKSGTMMQINANAKQNQSELINKIIINNRESTAKRVIDSEYGTLNICQFGATIL